MILFHRLDAAEPATSSQPRLLGRESGGHEIAFGQLEMRQHFGVELAIEPILAAQCDESGDERAQRHDLASRKRVTRAVAFSQFSTSTCSCLDPVLVSS